MPTRTTRFMTFVLSAGTFGLLLQGQSVAAQNRCKDVKANWVDVYTSGSTSSGTITNGGILNGTTLTAYTSGAFSTPVPTTVSYTSELTITTNQGQLKATLVYLYDFPTGYWTALGRISPNTSTGKFAGTTGVLYFNGSTIGSAAPFAYPAQVSGQICPASE
jgi:hypothetical protein